MNATKREKVKALIDEAVDKKTCTKCGSQLLKCRRTMSAHAFMHIGIRPFSCRLCTKSPAASEAYTTRHVKQVKRHLRSVHQSVRAGEFDDNRERHEIELNRELNACFGK
jgi:hypothetical protein